MTQIQKIKAEIERRMLEDYNSSDAQKDEIAQGVCAGILTFINSLPQKPVSEDLKAEVQRWREHYMEVKERDFQIALRDVEAVAYHFANWQREQMLKDCLTIQVSEEDVNSPDFDLLSLVNKKIKEIWFKEALEFEQAQHHFPFNNVKEL